MRQESPDILLSVIVPVYNAEKYLYDSLGNLVNQTFLSAFPGGMEILLIDDASTDRSLQILNRCKEQFPGLITILSNEKNRGPGLTRNRGLDLARGQYVGFMDADDLIDATMYEKLYLAAGGGESHRTPEKMADFADCAVEIDKNGNSDIVLFTSPDYWGVLTDAARSHLIATPGFIVTRIFKKSLIEENHIRFRNSYMMEDHDFLSILFAKASSCAGVKEVLYRYVDNEESVSKRDQTCFFADYREVIQALYHRLHLLPNYAGIRIGTEFAILVLADRCLYVMDQLGRAGLLSIEEQRRMEQELRKQLEETVLTHPQQNPFISQKLGEEMKQRLFLFFQSTESLLKT